MVSWSAETAIEGDFSSVYHVSNVSSAGVMVADFTKFQAPMGGIVLGENNIAYAQNPQLTRLTSFNTLTGTPLWTHESSNSTILAATPDGGAIVYEDMNVVTLDSNGNPDSAKSWPIGYSHPFDAGRWVGVINDGSVGMSPTPLYDIASSIWPYSGGNREGQNGVCDNDLSALVREYSAPSSYKADFVPNCSDFTASSHSTNFSFKEFNIDEQAGTGHYPTWAIIRNALLTKLEDLRALNGGTRLRITSGYRSPLVNYDTETRNKERLAPKSRHVHGDAVDISVNQNEDMWTTLEILARSIGACVEVYDPKHPHLHADWRLPSQCVGVSMLPPTN